MKQQKQDRRSRRTCQLVSSAMIELLSEKRYDAITVQDILDRAGIGRSTFYTHYFDKEDVLTSLLEQQLETLNQQIAQRGAGQGIVPSLETFRLVHQHPPPQHCPAMVRGHTREVLWETAQMLLSRTIEQALTTTCAEKRSSSVPLAVVAQYLAGGRDAVYTGTDG